jgi:aspartate/methionine/tyrosine aminotransferase
VALADEHNIPLLADEVYADLAFDGPVEAIASIDPDAPVITFSSLSKAYLAPGGVGMARGRPDERLDDVLGAIKKLADGRLCSTAPMEYAIVAALDGDRSHQQRFRDAPARTLPTDGRALNAIDGHVGGAAGRGVLRHAESGAAAGQDRRRLRPRAAPRDRRALRYGSGFGTKPEDGFFRVVFLASPAELSEIYGSSPTSRGLPVAAHRNRVRTPADASGSGRRCSDDDGPRPTTSR